MKKWERDFAGKTFCIEINLRIDFIEWQLIKNLSRLYNMNITTTTHTKRSASV